MATGTAGANAILTFVAGKTLFLSLHTGAPGLTGNNELTSGTAPGYARQSAPMGNVANSMFNSTADIVFTSTSGGAWPAVNYCALWDAVTAGNLYFTTGLDAQVTAVAVASGGTGYVSGDVGRTVTVSGGTVQTGFSAAQVTISTVSGGAVTGVALANSNQYVIGGVPSSPAATSGGGTTGSGLTVTITSSFAWTLSAASTLTVPNGSLVFIQN
jgi:hypothetical protein